MLQKLDFFSDGKEFELIEAMFDYSQFSRQGLGLGDDGYVFALGKSNFVISTDSSVENIHFNLNWCSPEIALKKAVISNLSDINAMGGESSLVLFNLGALKTWNKTNFKRLGDILKQLQNRYQFKICGGDLVRKEKECFFSLTILGSLPGEPLLRSNARPGHSIYLSGMVGTAYAGFKILSDKTGKYKRFKKEDRIKARDFVISKFHSPQISQKLGPFLGSLGKKISCIDISDGLSSELHHLAKQSNCRMTIYEKLIPYYKGLPLLFDSDRQKEMVLHGGEDYQLLFTGAFSKLELKKINQIVKVYEIGQVTKGKGVFIETSDNKKQALAALGWSH